MPCFGKVSRQALGERTLTESGSGEQRIATALVDDALNCRCIEIRNDRRSPGVGGCEEIRVRRPTGETRIGSPSFDLTARALQQDRRIWRARSLCTGEATPQSTGIEAPRWIPKSIGACALVETRRSLPPRRRIGKY